MRKWLIACCAIFVCLGAVYWKYVTDPALFFQDPKYEQQAPLIANEISSHDERIVAYWSLGRRKVLIAIYGVIPEARQNQIVDLVESLKFKGLVDSPVTLNFYERENWIKSPPNEKGIGGESRGREKLLRSVKL